MLDKTLNEPETDHGQGPWALAQPARGHSVGNPRGRGVDRGRDDRRRDRAGANCRPRYRVVDVGDRVVLPGLIDTHVHINEPGRTEWEGFVTATRAAAAGGITTLVDMPLNSSPVTTTAEALALKLEAARGKLWVDCGFYGGVVPGASGQVGPLVAAGVLGFKAFLCHSGIDEFPNATEADLRAVMPELARAGVPLLVHAELVGDLRRSRLRLRPSRRRSYARHLASRPREWEHDAIRLMIDLCREFRCHVHIVHLSSADALADDRAGTRRRACR